MKPRRILLLALLAALVTLCAPAQEATIDQIVAKNLEALGGADAIKAINTLTMDIKMVIQGGMMEAPMKMYVKRPSSVRTEVKIQGREIVTAWDGATAWMINPLMGSGDPQKMDEKTAKSVSQNSDIESTIGLLAAYKNAGGTVELLGKEDVEGSPAFKVKVTRKSGDVQTYFIDAATYLPVKAIIKTSQMGQEMEVESMSGNYKKVNGVMMSFSSEQKVGGKPLMQMQIEKIEVNQPIDDALFKMPAAAPKPAEPKK